MLLLVSVLQGQQTRGVILGRVTDSSGLAVPNVEVTLLNEKTGLSSAARTGTTGEYTFVSLDPGSYAISASAQGFKKAVIQNVTLFVAQTARVDVTLEVGEVATSVEVQATIPVVQSERSSVGSVV
ncbi:MAG: carboxypeptidase regulatory-like domain-containing protein, partial [Bryobacteraceae bacterium]|nr:carboxypeptidase regulatory-like domain-containing protein [Bryobacteraceae bacterium]